MSSDNNPTAEQSPRRSHLERIFDSAGGRELIPAIVHGNSADLMRFFTARANWCCGHPYVADRIVTYGAFDDLLSELSIDRRLALVSTAVTIAETATDEHFHAALFLLNDLLPDDAIRPRPEGFSQSLLQFRERVIRLAHMPNLRSLWNTLATKQRCYKSSDDPLAAYTAAQLYLY